MGMGKGGGAVMPQPATGAPSLGKGGAMPQPMPSPGGGLLSQGFSALGAPPTYHPGPSSGMTMGGGWTQQGGKYGSGLAPSPPPPGAGGPAAPPPVNPWPPAPPSPGNTPFDGGKMPLPPGGVSIPPPPSLTEGPNSAGGATWDGTTATPYGGTPAAPVAPPGVLPPANPGVPNVPGTTPAPGLRNNPKITSALLSSNTPLPGGNTQLTTAGSAFNGLQPLTGQSLSDVQLAHSPTADPAAVLAARQRLDAATGGQAANYINAYGAGGPLSNSPGDIMANRAAAVAARKAR